MFEINKISGLNKAFEINKILNLNIKELFYNISSIFSFPFRITRYYFVYIIKPLPLR